MLLYGLCCRIIVCNVYWFTVYFFIVAQSGDLYFVRVY